MERAHQDGGAAYVTAHATSHLLRRVTPRGRKVGIDVPGLPPPTVPHARRGTRHDEAAHS
eukprot:scaffold141457_cov93-Phaeocystis_antarctica.AAC.1